jgi:hypothetical protein
MARAMRIPSRLGGLAIALLGGAGCVGIFDQPGSGGGNQTQDQCTGSTSLGVTPLRKLTNFEYDNTVHDLLGDNTQPASMFPPDEVRLGFDNNAASLGVSPVLTEGYMNAAESLSQAALTAPPPGLLPCSPASLTTTAAEDACATQFIASFGKRAFRRPVSSSDATALLAVFHAGRMAQDFTTGLRYVMETVLQSPQFLYRVELAMPLDSTTQTAPLDGYEMASRLSYLLWGSMPDDALMAAADAGQLSTDDQIASQVARMMADPRAHAQVAHFNYQWMQLGKMVDMTKSATAFPSYTPAVGTAMQEETNRFLEEVMWGQAGDIHELLTASYTFVNGPLAQYYGVSGGPSGSSTWQKVAMDPAKRAGILTEGGVMAMLGKADQTSIVHRGKFVREQLLCGIMPAPPPNVPMLPPVSPTATTRERQVQHVTDPACSGCHRLMDPIGFGFEKYDGVGLWRETESGQPIDDSGEIQDSDVAGPFVGAAQLGQKLASSTDVESCVVLSWFHYGYGRNETTDDQCVLSSLGKQFGDAGYKFQDLIVALTKTPAFRYRRATGGGQ